MLLRNSLAASSIVLLAGCSLFGGKSSTTPPPATSQVQPFAPEVSLSRQSGAQARLHALYWPLASAAKDYCRERGTASIGAILASANDYPKARQEEANRALGLDERLRFTDILPKSPAGRAGIMPGDILLAVNLQPSSTWMQALNGVLSANGGLRLSLERDFQRIDTVVRPERHCVSAALTEFDAKKPQAVVFPLAFVEQMEDVPLRGALAWRIAQLALANPASTSQVDELAATLLRNTQEPIEALWSVRSSQASGARRSSFELAPSLGLPSKEIDLATRLNIDTTLVSRSILPGLNEAGLAAYQRYSNRALPKAFVTSTDGRWAAAWGRADALDHALGICRREGGQACSPFAINAEVVAR